MVILRVDPVLFRINVDEIANAHLTVFDYGHLKGGKTAQDISRVISKIENKNPDYSFLSLDDYYSQLERIPEKYRHLDPETEGRKLLETATPLDEYLANKNTLMFSLPEIFISTPLTPNRFKVAKEQPILESLYCKDAPVRDYCIALLVFKIPELREWAESFLYDGSYNFSSDLMGFRSSLGHMQRYGAK